jgi:HlyD family secretion protein
MVAAAVASMVAGLSATGPAAAEAVPAEPPQPPAVTVVRAAEREIVERVVVTGTLMPREEILVAPEVEGLRTVEVLAEEGDRVKQGQVLARLSRDILETALAQNQATIARAEAGIAQARSQILQAEAAEVEAAQALERTRALVRTGSTTQAQLEQRVSAAQAAEAQLAAARDGLRIAEAEKRSAEAARREIELRLARTEIKAPQAGIVSRRTARVGATASAAGEPLFRIIANGEIELEGEVTETQLPRIREGAPAEIVLGDLTIPGRVRNVLPEVDRTTRLGKIRIALGADPVLRIGAFARGTVELARRTGVAVPMAAVIYGPKGPVVQVVAGNKVQSRPVKTGLAADGVVEIREGLAAGEDVVAKAGGFLRDGDAVRPVVAASAEAGGRE